MNQPNPALSDIKLANELNNMINAYIQPDSEKMPRFVFERISKRLTEIKLPYYRASIEAFLALVTKNTDKGIAMFEQLLSEHPSDVVNWMNYGAGMQLNKGFFSSLEVDLRGERITKDHRLMANIFIFSASVGDFVLANKYLNKLEKLEKLEPSTFFKVDQKALDLRVDQTRYVCKTGKAKEVKGIGEIIFSLLDNDTHVNTRSTAYAIHEPDEDEPTLVFRVECDQLSELGCANLNVELTKLRVKEGLTDWSVIGHITKNN